MKTCISKIISSIIWLWRTSVKYVCKLLRHKVRVEDVDNDGVNEIVLDPNGSPIDDENIAKKEENENGDK